MKKTFLELVNYLKNPISEEDENRNFLYRVKKFGYILLICLLTGVVISPVFSIIEAFGWINMEDHAIEDMMEQLSKTQIFLFVVIVAPLFEELIFRAPLTLLKNLKSFKTGFYTFAIIFGLIHIFNFNMTLNVILLTPILVAPQIILGGYLGFIRVRFGLIWSIGLHACYNGVLMAITFAPDLF